MNGYLPLRDYAMIGNCRTAALVSRDGSIDWCCLPRFDSPALFCRLLDAQRGPYLKIGPTEEARIDRDYLSDTNILKTRFHTESGALSVTDFLPVPPENSGESADLEGAKILRLLEVEAGTVQVRVTFRLAFDFGRIRPEIAPMPDGVRATTGKKSLHLKLPGKVETTSENGDGEIFFRMGPNERRWVILCYGVGSDPPELAEKEAEDALKRTCAFWRDWIGRCSYDGKRAKLVKRSAIVLKSLIYHPTGALIAAPTTSLPERIGGNLNWDYRFAWLRDSGLIIDVLQRLGYHDESIRFLDWIEELCFCSKNHLQPVYRIDGAPDLPEEEVSFLEGYRRSRPVRVGNAAAKQFQLDVPGQVLEAAYLCYVRMPRAMKPGLWKALSNLADLVADHWHEPDDGIWEDRDQVQQHLHSKVLCWVALDRAVRLADKFQLSGPIDRWRRSREELRQVILTDGYDSHAGTFRQILQKPGCDATALVIPQVDFLPALDPRVQSTVAHLQAHLSRDGLLDRNHRRAEGEGAFLLCSFWLVNVLVASQRRKEAEELFERVIGFGNDLGLFPEEVDPASGELLGNFPQGFTHLALIRSALKLG